MDVLPQSEPSYHMNRSLSDLHRVTLWEWRRFIAELYAEIRTLDPIIGWQRWRSTRDHLFRIHVQSPIALTERASFVGLNYFAYEPSLRCIVALDGLREVSSTTIAVGEDGEVTLLP